MEKLHGISHETNRKVENQEKTTEKLKINGDVTQTILVSAPIYISFPSNLYQFLPQSILDSGLTGKVLCLSVDH